jgi:hypothetical protein
MSRPPRPIFRVSTTGNPAVRNGPLTVAPQKFGALVKLEQDLAAEEEFVSIVGAEGDFAQSVIELSALLGHALSVYQDLFASEAYLGTAQMPRSLVRHARRLAYEPDMGASATGHVVVRVGKQLTGILPAGFALSSVPRGEQKAQDYETLADIVVNAAWNDLRPVDSVRAANVVFDASGATTIRVTGTGFGLQPGDRVLVVSSARWLSLTVASATEDAAGGATLVSVTAGPVSQAFAAAGHTMLAKPILPLHLFGWNAPSNVFSASALQNSGQYTPLDPSKSSSEDSNSGYTVSGIGNYRAQDVYLDQEVKSALTGTFVLLGTDATTAVVCQVAAQMTASVSFTTGTIIGISITTFDTHGTPSTTTQNQLVENSISASVSAVQLRLFDGSFVDRTTIPVQPLSLANWSVQSPLSAVEPNPAVAGDHVDLPASLDGMRPGRPLVLSTIDETVAQVVELRKFDTITGGTRIWLTPLTPLPTGFQWALSNVKILGNVAQISHGKSLDETLGSSDGITPFQQFTLKKTPVTLLPAASGVAPALEVHINEVAWRLVTDFADSNSRDRVFRRSTDENQQTTVVFGDGKLGAVPPSGNNNISTHYRTGLGTVGNAGPGQISRIKKTNPLIDTARNLTEVNGGTDPARFEDVRSLAVRYIRTFDRAVSVPDYADLALLFPGVARATASWDDLHGVLLVAATAEGETLDAKDKLRAFLDLRRDTQLPLVLIDPQPVDVYLNLTVNHDPAFLTENVKRSVQDAFFGTSITAPGMFTFGARQFGQPAFLSEIYAASEGINGVTIVKVTRLALSATAVVSDTLVAAPSQWLRLQPQNFELAVSPGASS